MNDIQEFLRQFTQEPHTIIEIINALKEKGLTDEEAASEFKTYEKSIPLAGFDQHFPFEFEESDIKSVQNENPLQR